MPSDHHTPHALNAPLTSAQINIPLSEIDAELTDLRSGAGPLAINGGSFVNSYDTALWVAPANNTGPTVGAQAIYAQLRITGNAGSVVHDGAAFEIRLNTISNSTFLNAIETSVVVTGGANTIANARALTGNFVFEGTPTGTITTAIILSAQNLPAVPGGLTVTTAYGVYVDQQTRATTNWSVYAPGGNSLFGQVKIEQAAGAAADLQFGHSSNLRWIMRRNSTAESGANAGSDFEVQARADDGSNIGTVYTITRSTMGWKFGTGPIGFFNTTPQTKKTVTGSRGGNAALQSLLTQLAAYGLITDSSS